MAIQHLTYRDVSPDQRREGAKRARNQLQSLLQNPFLTPEQSITLQERMMHIDQWEKGSLEIPQPLPQVRTLKSYPKAPELPPAPPTKPTKHEVTVDEDVSVDVDLDEDENS